MTGQLVGKVALITGAGSGIGRQTALLFARAGAKVVIAEYNASSADETKRMVEAAGGAAIAVQTDVRDEESVERGIAAATDTYGRLDILHNNAGGSVPTDGPVGDVGVEEFWRAIKLDLLGTWLGCHYAIPELKKSGGGSIINMASMVALMGNPGKDAYTAAKGGIVALTRSMAVEYGPHKIRVNAIAPSATKTERAMKLLEGDPIGRALVARHLVGLPEPQDIAEAALFLASDASRMITGHILPVDSGVTIS